MMKKKIFKSYLIGYKNLKSKDSKQRYNDTKFRSHVLSIKILILKKKKKKKTQLKSNFPSVLLNWILILITRRHYTQKTLTSIIYLSRYFLWRFPQI